MNLILLCGRLTRDPEIRYTNSNKAVASFTLAVDRRFVREGDPTADFFNCTAFGKTAEIVEKYLVKGVKIIVRGEMQNNNYTNKDGQNVRDMRVIVDNIEFCESKSARSGQQTETEPASGDGFMNLPAGLDDELPFR